MKTDKKKAFVFDTNFIIENRNLTEVVSSLGDEFTVYVTQISIEERIAQQQSELRNKYEKIGKLSEEYKGIAKIEIITTIEKSEKALRERIEKGYKYLFKDNIIPFNENKETFSKVLERALMKNPPFLSVEGSSDKGFKDSLIWLSVLSFFKSKEEEEIIFVTNDNGFRKNADALCCEFMENTGKTIVFKDNSYYKSLFENEKSSFKQNEPIPEVKHLRERINNTLEDLCGIEAEDFWGQPEWSKTFSINSKVDDTDMEKFFVGLNQYITEHIFERFIPASSVFNFNEQVIDIYSIPMAALEKALSIYEEIKEKMPSYLPQFYDVAASIINKNFVEDDKSDFEPLDEERMPF